MLRRSVGLVLRPQAVEVVELARGLRRVRVAKSARVGIEGPEDAHVVGAIRRALALAQVDTRHAAVSVPAPEALLRFFVLPVLPRAEWEAAIQFEARKYIPFKMNDLLWDYTVCQRSGEKATEVIFSAIERNSFVRLQHWLAGAGVHATLIEPQSFSLARLVRLSERQPQTGFVVAVDVQPEAAHIAIVRNGLAYLAREARVAAGGSATQTGQAEATGQDTAAERLLSELRLSIDFFTREFAGARVDRVLLFGDERTVGPWCGQCAPHLRCPVELGRVPFSAPSLPSAESTTFAVGVGLACADWSKKGSVPLNFVRRAQAPVGASSGQAGGKPSVAGLRALHKPALAAVTAVALVLVGGLWFLGMHGLTMAKRQLAAAIQNRPDVGWGLGGRSQEELESLVQPAREQFAFLRRAFESRVSVAAKLDAMVRTLPDGVWLTGLTYEDPLSEKGESRPRLTVRGSCFLGEGVRELSAIQQFEERTKRETSFFKGFTSSRLAQISAKSDRNQRSTYRTFELDYRSDGSL